MSVKEKQDNERPSFSGVDEATGQIWSCIPTVRALQENPDLHVEPGDELIVDNFIPDMVTGKIGPVLFPEFIQKVSQRSN